MAQLQFDVNLSDRHKRKINQAKGARSKLDAYNKAYVKDSIRAAKQAWQTYKKTYKDSLKAVGRWKEAKQHQKELLLGKYSMESYRQYTIDTAAFGSPKDSLDWALQELAKRGDFDQLQSIYEAYGHYDTLRWEQYKPDSLQLSESELMERFAVKERLQNYLPEPLREASDFKVEQQLKHGALDGHGNLQHIDRSGVKAFVQQTDPKEFASSQISLAKAKTKFEALPDFKKESEGIKRQSLKGKPLKDRLYLTGNIGLPSTDPVIADVNIQVGYRWNTRLSTGVGLLLREQFRTRRDSTMTLTGHSHGLNFFSSYDITRGFFIYGEYQVVRNTSLFAREATTTAGSEVAGLLGLGKRFQISRQISLTLTFLYDFNYQNNQLHQRPWVPRVGYEITF